MRHRINTQSTHAGNAPDQHIMYTQTLYQCTLLTHCSHSHLLTFTPTDFALFKLASTLTLHPHKRVGILRILHAFTPSDTQSRVQCIKKYHPPLPLDDAYSTLLNPNKPHLLFHAHASPSKTMSSIVSPPF